MTPVRAVAAGRVRFAGWFRGYGKIVILDHGDGYLHGVGASRRDRRRGRGSGHGRGHPIGTVGETGSLRGRGSTSRSGARASRSIRRTGCSAEPPASMLRGPQRRGLRERSAAGPGTGVTIVTMLRRTWPSFVSFALGAALVRLAAGAGRQRERAIREPLRGPRSLHERPATWYGATTSSRSMSTNS